jgi:hypothetical protein
MAISSFRRFEFDLTIKKFRTELYEDGGAGKAIENPKEVLEEEFKFNGLNIKSAIIKLVDLLGFETGNY